MNGGAKKYIIKDTKILIKKFIDSIKYATSVTNLNTKLHMLLSRRFTYDIFGELGSNSGKKRDFSRTMFNRQKYYENSIENIRIKNINNLIIKYHYSDFTITQTFHLEEFKIIHFLEEVTKNKKKGGKSVVLNGGKADSGYYLDVANNHLVVQPQYRAY